MKTTAQAALALKVSRRRVQALIAAGRLPAEKLGRDWGIADDDLCAFAATVRKGGRPKSLPFVRKAREKKEIR
jgi:excisionase family DNA binding protein